MAATIKKPAKPSSVFTQHQNVVNDRARWASSGREVLRRRASTEKVLFAVLSNLTSLTSGITRTGKKYTLTLGLWLPSSIQPAVQLLQLNSLLNSDTV